MIILLLFCTVFCDENRLGWRLSARFTDNLQLRTAAHMKRNLQRDQTVSFLLNDPEYKALMKYCAKYKIKNRSRFIRETLMKAVLTRMTEDYPTLFHEEEMH